MKTRTLMKRLESIKEQLDNQHFDEVVFVERPLELEGLFTVNGEVMPAEEVKGYLNQERFSRSVIFIDDIPREDGSDEVYWGMDSDHNIVFYENEEQFLKQHGAGVKK